MGIVAAGMFDDWETGFRFDDGLFPTGLPGLGVPGTKLFFPKEGTPLASGTSKHHIGSFELAPAAVYPKNPDVK